MKSVTWVGLLLLGASTATFANPYLGFAAGQSDFRDSNLDKAHDLELHAGYQFDKYFAAELNYNDFGEVNVKDLALASIRTKSVGIAAKAILPLPSNFQVYARVGVHDWHATYLQSAATIETDKCSNKFLGVGATYKLNKEFGVGLRYTRYDLGSNTIVVTALNTEISF